MPVMQLPNGELRELEKNEEVTRDAEGNLVYLVKPQDNAVPDWKAQLAGLRSTLETQR